MFEVFLALFLALSALLLLLYVLFPGFRADVDADSRRRRQKSSNRIGRPADPADAEVWPDPPADPAAFDRWFETHGTSKDPRREN